jgi:acyl-CoA synthetase (AMP-forming)/AMP-acid ligase II
VKWLERASLLLARDVTLGTLLERLARLHGDRRLVEEAPGRDGEPPPIRLTFTEAADRVARLAAAIAEQVEPGDRVVIATPNSYATVLLMLAVVRAGAIAVPVNPRMRPAEIDHVINDSGATLVIRDEGQLADSAPTPAAPARARDVAAILYTSGTTGNPKGAELTHRALVGALGAAVAWPARLRRDEAAVGLPIAHVMGMLTVIGMAIAGIPVYFFRRFDATAVLDAIESRRSTMFVGVPAMYRMMLDAGAESRDLRSVRVWFSGADVMPSDLAERFKRMGATATLPLIHTSLGQGLFAEGYGMVELGGAVAARVSPPFLPVRFGEVLAPLPGYRMKIADPGGGEHAPGIGELLVKGPGVLRRYHGDIAATKAVLTEDGWLRTGDLARRGPFGMILFAGREKDVIKHGGYSVYATEVERAIEEHPAVAEAAAVGVPDERKGEVPAVVVRLEPGATATTDELLAFGRSRLSDYKAPRHVAIVDELPRTGTDKIQKDPLKSLFSVGRSTPSSVGFPTENG